MSINYSIYLASKLSEREVCRIVESTLQTGGGSAATSFRIPGLWISVSPVIKMREQVVSTAYGFSPTLSIECEVYPGEAYSTAHFCLFQLLDAIVKTTDDEFVMVYAGEKTTMQRLKGEFVLDATWFENKLNQSFLPNGLSRYGRRDLPSPLL